MKNHRVLRKLSVKSSLTKEDFSLAYALMDTHPTEYDCGKLCEKKCCQEYEPGVGMYLLPGEEVMFEGKEPWLKWSYRSARHNGYPRDWKGLVQFVECNGTCPREKRPIQCRTFPLAPYLSEDGRLSVVLDISSGIFLCPLVKEPHKFPLREEFRERVLSAWKLLSKDELIMSYIAKESRELDANRSSPWIKLFRP